jgi:membrane associated rhomboid family serine protease
MGFKLLPEGDGFAWWAIKLTLINIAVFGLSQLFPESYGMFSLAGSLVLERPWTLITHMFMHADLSHLYFNMFALAAFGSIFEKQVGSRTFLAVFFLGGLASAFAGIIFYQSVIGASGAIFSVLACMAVYRPKTVVWALGAPMYVIVALFIWMALDLVGFFQPDSTAHASHLAGMAYGISYGFWLRRERPAPKKPREHDSDLPSEKELEEWEEKWMVQDATLPIRGLPCQP